MIAALWFAGRTFTTIVTVEVTYPFPGVPDEYWLSRNGDVLGPRAIGLQCTADNAYYVNDEGTQMFFTLDGSGGEYPDPDPLCDDAIAERRLQAGAIGLAGIVVAIGYYAFDLVRSRQREEFVEARPVAHG